MNPDFTGLYAQFTQQFQDWFDHMKDQLDDDAAGHLQLEIDDIKADIGIVEDTDTATHTIAAGQYVIWKGSLYKASTAIPATTALSLSNLTAVSNGLGGEVASLNGNIANLFKSKTEELTSDSNSTIDLGLSSSYNVISVFTPNNTNVVCIPYLHSNAWRARIINATTGAALSSGNRWFTTIYISA